MRHLKKYLSITRWEIVPKGDKWRRRFVAREFRHDDPEMEGLYTSGSTSATGGLVDVHAVQIDTRSCALMRRMRTSTLRKTRRKCIVSLRKNGSCGIIKEVVEWRNFGGC